MRQYPLRHGSLFTALCLPLLTGPSAESAHPVRSSLLDIEYAIDNEAQSVTSVQLWYTLDDGTSWRPYGPDPDRRSPVTFRAEEEGVYGFFLVVANAVGPSSADPTPGTIPHIRALVDHTPPIVQVHAVRQTAALGQRVVQIRWTAFDAHFGGRPVEIAFRTPSDSAWKPVMPRPLANTGSYDWRLPEDVTGRVAIRLAVRDKVGHLVHSDEQWVEVAPVMSAEPDPTGGFDGRADAADFNEAPIAVSGSPRARERARQLQADARKQQERGDLRRAVSLLRQAVKLDPQSVDAFIALGDLLDGLEQTDRALAAYELALRLQPQSRNALRGAARVRHRQNDDGAAAGLLRRILLYNPADAEVWMDLGEVALHQGDEVLARECFLRASQLDPEKARIVPEARKRLDMLNGLTRSSGRDES